MERLLKRADFLAVAKGAKASRRGFLLQALAGDPAKAPRCGFTVTKKTGNAVVRNRIRRRLREAIRLHGPLHARLGTDYVVIGREDALRLEFAAILVDLAGAFRQVHARLDSPARQGEAAAGSAPERAAKSARHDRTSTRRGASTTTSQTDRTGRTE